MISYKSERGYPHPLFLSGYLPFQLFSGIGTKIVSFVRKYKILIICKDMDVVPNDMQPCMDALVKLSALLRGHYSFTGTFHSNYG